jgi:hypothetical protein
LWASAEDLGHYLVAHLNGGRYGDAALVSPEGMALLHTPDVTIEGDALYAMGWNQFPFADAAPPDDPDAVPVGQASGGRWPNYRALLFVVPEYDTGVALLMNANDSARDSQFNDAGWNALLLALGRETVDYPPQQDFFTRNERVLLPLLILILLAGVVWSIRYLRRQPPGRPRLLWVVLPLVLEIGLALYSFFGRIEGPRELSLMLRSDAPDVGLMFPAVLALTLGWGPLRTYLLLRNR